MTVAEMLTRISSAELTEWIAYERISGPLGPERGDVLNAITAATIVNANRGKRGRRATPRDFMPRWDRRGQAWEEQLAIVKQWNAALGGTDRTGR